ncbi:MAG: diadenylate cyclase domain-containing protein, partial [Haloferacaceae archaeon]
MDTLEDVLSDLVADVDGVFLFTPNGAFYERFADVEDVVVVAPENTVGADTFVELPVEFDNIKDRIRFGIEGAMDAGLVEEGTSLACLGAVFGEDADFAIRVRVDETMRSGIYDLFANSRAEPSVIRDVFDVALE